jgi:hypothetical protein
MQSSSHLKPNSSPVSAMSNIINLLFNTLPSCQTNLDPSCGWVILQFQLRLWIQGQDLDPGPIMASSHLLAFRLGVGLTFRWDLEHTKYDSWCMLFGHCIMPQVPVNSKCCVNDPLHGVMLVTAKHSACNPTSALWEARVHVMGALCMWSFIWLHEVQNTRTSQMA